MGNFSIKYTHKLLIIVREIKKPLATRFTGVGNFLYISLIFSFIYDKISSI